MCQQNFVIFYILGIIFGGSQAVICEQMDKSSNVNGAFFSVFYCELAQNLFLALLLPKPMHISRSEFYFVAYQKL